jgi:hypothetical protein
VILPVASTVAIAGLRDANVTVGSVVVGTPVPLVVLSVGVSVAPGATTLILFAAEP